MREQLGLSFSNAWSMLQHVDAIPERCGQWFSKRLSFKDRPNEHFVVHHRNPVEAIKGLWGDLAFSRDLVYKPAKLFRGGIQTEEERVFSEMWTAGFWNAAQVFTSFLILFIAIQSNCLIGTNSQRRNNRSRHHCLRQDPVDTVLRE